MQQVDGECFDGEDSHGENIFVIFASGRPDDMPLREE